ncbi:MAG: hypothetical protein KDK70_41490, partial [Myxococcales bacterium]|nr:hypothetical protein [Myxococcales bacterium]
MEQRSSSTRRRSPWWGLSLCGVALWGLWMLARPVEPLALTIDAATVAALRDDFSRQRGRPPSEAETAALVDDW